jgi:hypothetical protein
MPAALVRAQQAGLAITFPEGSAFAGADGSRIERLMGRILMRLKDPLAAKDPARFAAHMKYLAENAAHIEVRRQANS